jgi:hypothetical protein
MSDIRLTRRGYRVAAITATIAFLAILGFAGWIETGL